MKAAELVYSAYFAGVLVLIGFNWHCQLRKGGELKKKQRPLLQRSQNCKLGSTDSGTIRKFLACTRKARDFYEREEEGEQMLDLEKEEKEKKLPTGY